MQTLGLGFTWEQLSPGQRFRTLNRTITETDLVLFIGVTGMLETIFVDRTFGADKGAIQGAFVPAALTYSLIEGLLCQSMIQGTGLAMLELKKQVVAPVRVGDTVHGEIEVTSVRPTSKGNRGIVVSRIDVSNENDEVVMTYELPDARGPRVRSGRCANGVRAELDERQFEHLGITSNPRTWPIIDGKHRAEAIELTPTVLHPSELFWRQLRFGEFAVSEMSVSSLMAGHRQGRQPLRRPAGLHHAALLPHRHPGAPQGRHRQAGGPQGQARRRAGISADRRAVDARRRSSMSSASSRRTWSSGWSARRRSATAAPPGSSAAGRHRAPYSGGEEHRLDDARRASSMPR